MNNTNKEIFIANVNGKKMELMKATNTIGIQGSITCSRCGGSGNNPDTVQHRPNCPYLTGKD